MEVHGWMGGDGDDEENLPEAVRRWRDTPDPEEIYSPAQIEFIYMVLTRMPPRYFGAIRDIAVGDDSEHDWNAALGLAIEFLNDQLATYPRGTAQFDDAAARADELQRITLGDD